MTKALSAWPCATGVGHHVLVARDSFLVLWWERAFKHSTSPWANGTQHSPCSLVCVCGTGWLSQTKGGMTKRWKYYGSSAAFIQQSPKLAVGSFISGLEYLLLKWCWIFVPCVSFFPSSLQSKNVPAEQSQGEAEEQHQCRRPSDCCVCFPFLVHFSNSLNIELDSTWTEVAVFHWPVLLKLQRDIMFWCFLAFLSIDWLPTALLHSCRERKTGWTGTVQSVPASLQWDEQCLLGVLRGFSSCFALACATELCFELSVQKDPKLLSKLPNVTCFHLESCKTSRFIHFSQDQV